MKTLKNKFKIAKTEWLSSPSWDFLWMFPGFWILPLVLCGARIPLKLSCLLGTMALFLGLMYRLKRGDCFCFSRIKVLFSVPFKRFILIPLLILFLTSGFVFIQQLWMPLSIKERVCILAILFFVVNSYRFGINHLGVLSLYRGRSSQQIGTSLKLAEKTYCLVVGGAVLAFSQLYHGVQVVETSLVYHLISRETLMQFFSVIRYLVPVFILKITIGLACAQWKAHVSWPKFFYILSLALQGILAFVLEPLVFLVFWALQYVVVSMGLAVYLEKTTSKD